MMLGRSINGGLAMAAVSTAIGSDTGSTVISTRLVAGSRRQLGGLKEKFIQ